MTFLKFGEVREGLTEAAMTRPALEAAAGRCGITPRQIGPWS